MKLSKISLALSAAALAAFGSANAAVVVLDFEGVNATYPSGYATVGEFYNGGNSGDGTTGTNYGISFSREALAICLNSTTVFCSNTSRGGQGDPNSQKGGLFFLSGTQTYMNIAAGFDTGFSFFYAAINNPGAVKVYEGENGTGTLLATVNLPTTTSACSGYSAGFCPFKAAGVAFSGVAHSVSFAGVADQVVFDDVTFGSKDPGQPNDVPEPASFGLVGLALLGLAASRKRKAA